MSQCLKVEKRVKQRLKSPYTEGKEKTGENMGKDKSSVLCRLAAHIRFLPYPECNQFAFIKYGWQVTQSTVGGLKSDSNRILNDLAIAT